MSSSKPTNVVYDPTKGMQVNIAAPDLREVENRLKRIEHHNSQSDSLSYYYIGMATGLFAALLGHMISEAYSVPPRK